AIELRAIGFGTHLECARRAHRGRTPGDRALRQNPSRFRRKSPRAALIAEPQKRVKSVRRSDLEQRLCQPRCRCWCRENRVAGKTKGGNLSGNAGGELRDEEIVGSERRGCRKDHASRNGGGIDGHILIDGESD